MLWISMNQNVLRLIRPQDMIIQLWRGQKSRLPVDGFLTMRFLLTPVSVPSSPLPTGSGYRE